MQRRSLVKNTKLTITIPVPPSRLVLSRDIEAGIWCACLAARNLYGSEVEGFAALQETGDVFEANSDIVIPFQQCSGASTLTAGETGEGMEALWAEVRDNKRDPVAYSLWWHSHVRGLAHFSGTDFNMIRRHLRVMLDDVHASLIAGDSRAELPDSTATPYFLSLVGNVQGDMSARYDILVRVRDLYLDLGAPIEIVRTLPGFSKADRVAILRARYPHIESLVKARVSLEQNRR